MEIIHCNFFSNCRQCQRSPKEKFKIWHNRSTKNIFWYYG